MASFPSEPSGSLFELRPGVTPVVFESDGFWHPAGSWRRSGGFTRYEDVTHLAASRSGLWLGTRGGVHLLRGSLFRSSEDPERLAQELLARIAARPGGAEQLGRIADVDRIGARRGARATSLLALACLGVFGAQVAFEPFVHEAGAFSSRFAAAGEWWRVLTANLLHAGPGHLLMNLLGIVFLGNLVERPLGTGRTVVIMGAAALGAMLASAAMRSEDVVGASGIVFGLVGAALFLEFFRSDRLPATLRIPRRLFLGALAADVVLGAVVPFIAGSAHMGGLAGGFLAGAAVARDRTLQAPAPRRVRAAAVAVAAALVAALLWAAPLVRGDADALERHGRRILNLDAMPTLERAWRLNNVAWRMASEGPASEEQLELALDMAERAAEATGRAEPDILDTLAELQWANGQVKRALRTIDEAIALAPEETYFREQRRRFLGERAADDRPEPPAEDAPYRRRTVPLPSEPAPERDDGVWI